MKRRDFLAAGFATLAANPMAAVMANDAPAAEPRDWTLGWQNVSSASLAPKALTVEGTLPAAVHGALFRNGPAKTERDGVRYRHWFDGDGMIQRFRISERGVVHDAQFVRTEKFVEEEAAGRFLYDGAGTVLSDGRPSRNNDSANVANTALLPWDGELLALWEGGSAYRVDPSDLSTLGRKDWRDDLKHMPFSAHPLVDTDGTLWNFASASFAGGDGVIVIYEIAPDSTVRNVQTIRTKTASYAHSFLMTERYLVFYQGSHIFEHGASTFVDGFRWQPEKGSRVLVVDKNDLSAQRWFDVPPGFVFHGAHAFDRGDEIVARVCLYPDAGIMASGMIALMQSVAGQPVAYPDYERAELATLRLNRTTGKVAVESTGALMEFPGINPRFAHQSTPVFGVGHADEAAATVSDAVIRVDPETGARTQFVFPAGHIVEEPLFVADERAGRDGGWLVGTFLDYHNAGTGVYVLNSQRLADGPVAMARSTRSVPLGFHGCFVNTV